MRDFTKYDIWNESVELSVKIYSLTKDFPESEKFGLTSQIRRAAISIAANFAEGCSRSSEKDSARFLEIAVGSTFELKTLAIISNKIGYLNEGHCFNFISLLDQIAKRTTALKTKLQVNEQPTAKANS
jgi:four helix bundle protein